MSLRLCVHIKTSLLHAESYKVTKLQTEFSIENCIHILYLYYMYYNINIIYEHVATLNQMTGVKTVV